jgi:hypothetical protein
LDIFLVTELRPCWGCYPRSHTSQETQNLKLQSLLVACAPDISR